LPAPRPKHPRARAVARRVGRAASSTARSDKVAARVVPARQRDPWTRHISSPPLELDDAPSPRRSPNAHTASPRRLVRDKATGPFGAGDGLGAGGAAAE